MGVVLDFHTREPVQLEDPVPFDDFFTSIASRFEPDKRQAFEQSYSSYANIVSYIADRPLTDDERRRLLALTLSWIQRKDQLPSS